MDAFVVRASVPVVSFRPYLSRDYQDTYPVPPPATAFGMLLSLCGIAEAGRPDFGNTELAIMVDRVREPSPVLRRLRRDSSDDQRHGRVGYRPDYQELILGLRVWIAVRQGDAARDLADCARDALKRPERLDRYGALSLGESTFLVDEISVFDSAPRSGISLRPDGAGSLTLPVWVDYQDPKRTRLQRFSLEARVFSEDDFVQVGPGG
ncbi:type I-MYXAN CRISPR-associated protein Cas5/Cmx5/DevS [Candidatus Palauibacter sp.]|uniref:type I-MYXAN CRISPR-associated protein Cas5/Cmx5/DevS n=1 Tax=Candidatus Palauibacter sp. TaxID=3101350 RepID=UPI003B5230CE